MLWPPATAPWEKPLPLFDRPAPAAAPELMLPLDTRACGTGPWPPLRVLRSAYVLGAMRTNVVSCDNAAVTLLFGVLHVPQLYSLRRGDARRRKGGRRVSRGVGSGKFKKIKKLAKTPGGG